MKKLTFEEIIERLKEIFEKVDEFVEGVYPYEITDFPEAIEAEKERLLIVEKINKELEHITDLVDKAVKKINHPKLKNSPDPYEIAEKLWFEKIGLIWEYIATFHDEDYRTEIYYFPQHDVYIKIEGHMSRNEHFICNGWDSIKEVKPFEKLVTLYKEI